MRDKHGRTIKELCKEIVFWTAFTVFIYVSWIKDQFQRWSRDAN